MAYATILAKMHENTNIAIVIPCYNEEHNFSFFEQELAEFIKESAAHSRINIQFFIVDNNSTDKTPILLIELAEKFNNHIRVLFCQEQGYGAALKMGFSKVSTYNYVGFLDFDNTYPLKSIIPLFETLLQNNLDLIYGARLHGQSNIEPIRAIGNLFYLVLLKALYGYKLGDACSGLRIFKTELIPEIIKLKQNNLAFSIEFTLLAIQKKWRIDELPIPYRGRSGHSKLSVVKDGFSFLKVIILSYGKLRINKKNV